MKTLWSLILLFFVATFSMAQTCSTSIDGHQVCDFSITKWFGLTSEPAESTAGTGVIYLDSSEGVFKCSEDGGSYTTCMGASGGGGGSTVTLQYGDSTTMSGTFTIDFNSSEFEDDEDPTDEWNVDIKDIYVFNSGDTMTSSLTLADTSLKFDEAADTMTVSVPALTADRAVTFPDAAGEVSLLGQTIGASEMADEDHGDLTWSSGNATIDPNAVALSTDTTGNYVATVADSGNTTISVSGSGSEGAAVALDAIDLNCTNCIGGTEIGTLDVADDTDLTVNTPLTLSGSTITLNDLVNADISASAAISMSKTALVAGTNLTLSTDTLNVDDAFVLNTTDSMSGSLTVGGSLALTGHTSCLELETDVSGTIVCKADDAGGGGTPGGNNTEVQFNDGGSFGGDAGMTYVKATDFLTVAGTTSVAGMTVSGTVTFAGLDCSGNANGGALTTDANGDVTCSDDDGGGGSGDVVTVNSTAIDTTANFLDGDIDFTHVDGGAGGPDDVTATVGCTGCVDGTDILDGSVDIGTDTDLSVNTPLILSGSTLTLNDLVNADISSSAAISVSKTALVAGDNLTLATDTLNVDDAFVLNTGDTMTGRLMIDGSADETQLTIQGHSTQTTSGTLFQIENSSAAELVSVDNDGDMTVTGTISTDKGVVVNSSADSAIDFEGVTADPCGSYTSGTVFYNSTSGYFCFCDNSNADIKMNDNSTACF